MGGIDRMVAVMTRLRGLVKQVQDRDAFLVECGVKASTLHTYCGHSGQAARAGAVTRLLIVEGLRKRGIIGADVGVDDLFPPIYRKKYERRTGVVVPPNPEKSKDKRAARMADLWLQWITAGELSVGIVRDLYRDARTTEVTRKAAALVLERAPLRPRQSAVIADMKELAATWEPAA